MTSPSPRVSKANRARSMAFRRSCIDYLQQHGFEAASASEPSGLSVADRLRERHGEIVGVEPWILGCRARETTFDLAAGLDRVRWQAENANSPYYALIQMRRQHPAPEQATVVMSLKVFTLVLVLLEALRDEG